jgi:hypothetical protein
MAAFSRFGPFFPGWREQGGPEATLDEKQRPGSAI